METIPTRHILSYSYSRATYRTNKLSNVREGTSQRLSPSSSRRAARWAEEGASQTHVKTKLLEELIYNLYDTSFWRLVADVFSNAHWSASCGARREDTPRGQRRALLSCGPEIDPTGTYHLTYLSSVTWDLKLNLKPNYITVVKTSWLLELTWNFYIQHRLVRTIANEVAYLYTIHTRSI